VVVVSLVSVDVEVQPTKTTAMAAAATRTMLRPFAPPSRCLFHPIAGIRHHPYTIGNRRHLHKRQTPRRATGVSAASQRTTIRGAADAVSM
jgi:hypothetical protein